MAQRAGDDAQRDEILQLRLVPASGIRHFASRSINQPMRRKLLYRQRSTLAGRLFRPCR